MAGVEIEGLAELRADLSRMVPELDREVQRGLEDGAGFVADKVRSIAPRLRGTLVGSVGVFVEGDAAGVRITARRVSPRYPSGYAYPWKVNRDQRFLERAAQAEESRVERRMEDTLDEVARIWGGA